MTTHLPFGIPATAFCSRSSPRASEPGPAYNAPGICASSNRTCEPTCSTSGFFAPPGSRIACSAAGSILALAGIDSALAVETVFAPICASARGPLIPSRITAAVPTPVTRINFSNRIASSPLGPCPSRHITARSHPAQTTAAHALRRVSTCTGVFFSKPSRANTTPFERK